MKKILILGAITMLTGLYTQASDINLASSKLQKDRKELERQRATTDFFMFKMWLVGNFRNPDEPMGIAEHKTIADARKAIKKEQDLEKRILKKHALGDYTIPSVHATNPKRKARL